MLDVFMILFREGLEAFLAAGLVWAALKRTAQRDLLSAVPWGFGCAAGISVLAGLGLVSAGASGPAAEGLLSLLASLLILLTAWPFLKRGPSVFRLPELDSVLKHPLWIRWCAVFALVFLMVGREGVESSVMLASLARSGSSMPVVAAALAGFLGATVVALLVSVWGQRIPLSLFFRASGFYMLLLAAQLLFSAVHEFAEASLLPWLDNDRIHMATEFMGPEGEGGAWLSCTMALVPVLFVLVHLRRGRITQGGPGHAVPHVAVSGLES
jgi:high-affinity iron transporter